MYNYDPILNDMYFTQVTHHLKGLHVNHHLVDPMQIVKLLAILHRVHVWQDLQEVHLIAGQNASQTANAVSTKHVLTKNASILALEHAGGMQNVAL